MFFNLFGSNKKEYIEEYAEKLAEVAVNDELGSDFMETMIDYSKEKGLDAKQLARAQALACDKAFDQLYHEGYMDDDEFALFMDLVKFCYMMKEDGKYRYTTIAKRCNALYKIQEKGLMPTMNKEYANVKYRDEEVLHFTTAGKSAVFRKEDGGECISISEGQPFKVGDWKQESTDGWKEGEKGAFYITSERIGFRGKTGRQETLLSDIESVEIGRGPLVVREEGKDSWAVFIDDYEMAGALLSRLFNREP